MEKKLKGIIVLIVILVLVAINLIIFIFNNQNNSQKETNNKVNTTQENTTSIDIYENKSLESIIDNKIANMEDDNRIKAYYGKFIKMINSKDYESAYNCLNDSFKANYFTTLEEFAQYMENKYPKNRIVVEYNNVERKGEVFVLGVVINDAIDPNFQEFSESVVIREISANNFSLSFSKDYKDTSERSK